jgi:hypothetical protein
MSSQIRVMLALVVLAHSTVGSVKVGRHPVGGHGDGLLAEVDDSRFARTFQKKTHVPVRVWVLSSKFLSASHRWY